MPFLSVLWPTIKCQAGHALTEFIPTIASAHFVPTQLSSETCDMRMQRSGYQALHGVTAAGNGLVCFRPIQNGSRAGRASTSHYRTARACKSATMVCCMPLMSLAATSLHTHPSQTSRASTFRKFFCSFDRGVIIWVSNTDYWGAGDELLDINNGFSGCKWQFAAPIARPKKIRARMAAQPPGPTWPPGQFRALRVIFNPRAGEDQRSSAHPDQLETNRHYCILKHPIYLSH
ncbi:hypothetical protein N657DRAFT_420464 [Parathielavia appendiculata]|uniref:Uncharacterized protein n=1 Tax=Parathielavia appendiculata TaxID=2587402 RepID=A0AAN6U004_9PEZI|nr:hypothetical protein N657DRAFT_420464 [Parathielavia appendiculata]